MECSSQHEQFPIKLLGDCEEICFSMMKFLKYWNEFLYEECEMKGEVPSGKNETITIETLKAQ